MLKWKPREVLVEVGPIKRKGHRRCGGRSYCQRRSWCSNTQPSTWNAWTFSRYEYFCKAVNNNYNNNYFFVFFLLICLKKCSVWSQLKKKIKKNIFKQRKKSYLVIKSSWLNLAMMIKYIWATMINNKIMFVNVELVFLCLNIKKINN